MYSRLLALSLATSWGRQMLIDRFFDLVAEGRIKSVVFDLDPFEPTFQIFAEGERVTMEEGRWTCLRNDELVEYLKMLRERGLYEVRLVFKPGVEITG